MRHDGDTDRAIVGHVEAILHRGQSAGEFRDFDPLVMAAAVQRTVESLPFLLESARELDCRALGRDVATTFELHREPVVEATAGLPVLQAVDRGSVPLAVRLGRAVGAAPLRFRRMRRVSSVLFGIGTLLDAAAVW
jgi:hypothetical protein